MVFFVTIFLSIIHLLPMGIYRTSKFKAWIRFIRIFRITFRRTPPPINSWTISTARPRTSRRVSNWGLAYNFAHSSWLIFVAGTRPISHRVGRSVRPSVRRSVRRSVTLCFICIFGHFQGWKACIWVCPCPNHDCPCPPPATGAVVYAALFCSRWSILTWFSDTKTFHLAPPPSPSHRLP